MYVSQCLQNVAKGCKLPLMKAGNLGHRSKPFEIAGVEGRKAWDQMGLGSNPAGHSQLGPGPTGVSSFQNAYFHSCDNSPVMMEDSVPVLDMPIDVPCPM